jgi:hypothetical protein
MDEPLKHLLRPMPPWETHEITQCGRPANQVGAITDIAALLQHITTHGKQRTAYTHCMVCFDTEQRHSVLRFAYGEDVARRATAVAATWETQPRAVLRRWLDKTIDDTEGERVRRTLHALGRLVEAHQGEFDAMVEAEGVSDLAARRRGRRGA